MNKTSWGLAAAAAALGFMNAAAEAATFGLFEYAFNIDGAVANPPTNGDPVPVAVNLSGFNTGTGLGTVLVTVTGAGSHSVSLFVDHEIDEAINGFSNEYGGVSGTPAAGQSWEIDEPGYSFGDIYANFAAGSLDNSNGVGAAAPDDVSMALAWDFTLNPDEQATLSFILSQTAPPGGFYLTQTDPDSAAASISPVA